MHALREVQSQFLLAMLAAPEDAPLAPLLAGQATHNHRRIEAYRRNMFAALGSALAMTYPVTQRIVGEAFFRAMARAYVRVEPSRSGDLNDYGENFSEFISAYPHAQELAYLPDVARLEWQLQCIDLAADSLAENADAPFAALASTSPDHYDALRFALEPAVGRLDSRWPLADIWHVNQADFSGDMQVDFTKGCQLLLWRTPSGPQIAALGAAEATFLDALLRGHALAPAVSAALTTNAGFALGECLQTWIAAGVVRGAFLDPDRS